MHSNKKMLCGGEGEQFLVDSIERKETRLYFILFMINSNRNLFYGYNKRDFIIEKQIARHFVLYVECLSNPLLF